MTDLSKLTGAVRTLRPGSNQPFGIPWGNVARWEPWFSEAAAEASVNPLLIAAMAIVESDANQYRTGRLTGTRGQVIAVTDAYGGGPSVGIMQIKPFYWQSLLPDADAYTPRGNIRLGAKLMANFIAETGSWQNAIAEKYHPGTSGAGTTPQMYIETIKGLLREMRAQLGDADNPPSSDPNPPTSTPQPQIDPIAVIVGGPYPPITYGFRAVASPPIDAYRYGVGHGTQRSTEHTGVDVPVPHGTRIFTPLAGEVVCVGTAGRVVFGQGCGFFADDMYGGVGNITVLTDAGLKITFGHCTRALVSVGQRVAAGQPIGTSGGSNGDHLHLDVAEERNGSYWLLDPAPALRAAMGGQPVPPPPADYPDRIDIPQPRAGDTGWTVTVTADSLPVKQFGNHAAPDVAAPLRKGETFTAMYAAYTDPDGEAWWVTDRKGRVPVAGTSCPALFGDVAPVVSSADLHAVYDDVDAARVRLEALLRVAG